MIQHDIIQFNCNGFRGQLAQIIELIKKYRPKFLLLQELKISYTDKIKIKGYSFVTNLKIGDDHNATTVGILVKNGIIFKKNKYSSKFVCSGY